MKELNDSLKTEKSSRTDLEMYVAVLNTQKNVLQDDNDRLRSELQEGQYALYVTLCVEFHSISLPVCQMLDQERREHNDLKATWQMANDQFLESQRLMMMDLRTMEDVLSPEQQRQITGMLICYRKCKFHKICNVLNATLSQS
jgi:Rab GTPase-binding effector protein 1